MAGLNFNLLDQLAFYGAYHNNKWNQLIHFFCVPLILWSVLVWLSYAGSFAPAAALQSLSQHLPATLQGAAVVNAPLLVVAVYSAFYLALDVGAGLSWGLAVGLPLWLSATAFHSSFGPAAWTWALGAHVLGWYLQIHPGHAVLEGRKPALLDSLVQAFALAPLFVWFELLFLLGYRPRLRAELRERVGKAIMAYRRQEAGKGQ